jgi:hypothetical protein
MGATVCSKSILAEGGLYYSFNVTMPSFNYVQCFESECLEDLSGKPSAKKKKYDFIESDAYQPAIPPNPFHPIPRKERKKEKKIKERKEKKETK